MRVFTEGFFKILTEGLYKSNYYPSFQKACVRVVLLCANAFGIHL